MLDGNEMAVGTDGDMYINQRNLDAEIMPRSNGELLTRVQLVERNHESKVPDNPLPLTQLSLMPGAIGIVRNGNSGKRALIRTDAGENACFRVCTRYTGCRPPGTSLW